MTKTESILEQFLAASAAGGAIAPTLALIAQVMGCGAGGSDPVELASAERVTTLLVAANALAYACTDPSYPAPIQFKSSPGGHEFRSVNDTTVCITDRPYGQNGGHVVVGVPLPAGEDDNEGRDSSLAPDDNYRVRVAAAVADWYERQEYHHCGESQWEKLARFAALMATASKRG